jgi:hypothetical protein
MLRNGIVGVPVTWPGRSRTWPRPGVDTRYFHIYDATDPDHVRLPGTEVGPLVS